MSSTPWGSWTFFYVDRLIVSLSLFTLIFGLIGNFLNIFVFVNHKAFRKHRSIFYFTVESLVDSIQLSIIFTSRISVMIFQYDPTQSSLIWCKTRSMIAQSCTLISMTIVCLAVIDLYLSTHYRRRLRKFITIETAQIFVGLIVSFCLLHGIPFVLFFTIQSTAGCSVYQPIFSFYYKFIHLLILIGLLPLTLGTSFSLLAFRNVRRLTQRQISPSQRRLDRQLTAMVLARVLFMILAIIPFVVYRIYSLLIFIDRRNLLRKQIETLIFNSVVLVLSMNFSGPFYVFFFTSTRFRRQVKSVLLRTYRSIRRNSVVSKRNQVVPLAHISNASS